MTTVVVIILVAFLLFAALRLWITANRLDRLHVRTEAAWSALEGALARRIVATRAVAAAGGLAHPQSDDLRRLADIADNADRAHRADAENDLSRALSGIAAPTELDLAAELADASERVVLARRFYNDAVRDTRALRAVLFTRVFGLAGRAAMPDYFEIVENPHRAVAAADALAGDALVGDVARVGGVAPAYGAARASGDSRADGAARDEAAPVGDLTNISDPPHRVTSGPGDHSARVGQPAAEKSPAPAPVTRTAARVVLVDDTDRLLLLSGTDPMVDSRWWITPGGGVEAGEDLRTAALRELAEETGVHLQDDELIGPVWRRVARFAFTGIDYEQTEFYFTARSPRSPGRRVAVEGADGNLEPSHDGQAAGGFDEVPGTTMVADLPQDAPLDVSGHTDLERRTLTGHRWWATDELSNTDEAVYPIELAARVREVLDALRSGRPLEPVSSID